MGLEDYKTILYRQEDGSWVAEIPALPGCYALMPTREEALAELSKVFEMVAAATPDGCHYIVQSSIDIFGCGSALPETPKTIKQPLSCPA